MNGDSYFRVTHKHRRTIVKISKTCIVSIKFIKALELSKSINERYGSVCSDPTKYIDFSIFSEGMNSIDTRVKFMEVKKIITSDDIRSSRRGSSKNSWIALNKLNTLCMDPLLRAMSERLIVPEIASIIIDTIVRLLMYSELDFSIHLLDVSFGM